MFRAGADRRSGSNGGIARQKWGGGEIRNIYPCPINREKIIRGHKDYSGQWKGGTKEGDIAGEPAIKVARNNMQS